MVTVLSYLSVVMFLEVLLVYALSDVVTYYLSEDFISDEVSYVEVVANALVRTASVAGILKSIDEDYSELVQITKFLTSELVRELHTTSFTDGVVSELYDAIKIRLWDIEDEFKLSTFINDVVFLGTMVKEGVNDLEVIKLAREVVEEFADVFSLDLSRCNVLRDVMNSSNPALILQVMLLGLILAVGGLSYDGG